VRVKYDDEQLTPSDKLPESVNGLPTDVEEVGTFRSFQDPNPRTVIRPGPPGCSVGFEAAGVPVMAGTFGALVKRGSRRFILSNNHVLANTLTGLTAGEARPLSVRRSDLQDTGGKPVLIKAMS
jgi:hypothetical protein